MSDSHENTASEDQDDVQSDEAIGRAFRFSAVIIGLLLGVGLAVWAGSTLFNPDEKVESVTELVMPKEREVNQVTLPQIPLTPVGKESGLDWQHVSGMEGEKLLPETMGGGACVFDYDRDGDQDILFVGGASWPWAKEPNSNPRSLCLYANDGAGDFTDVSEQAGLHHDFYAMGPVVGDIDNDGWPDLFVTGVGTQRFFRNREGVFVDETQASGLAGDDQQWTTGATWFDYDRDGLLDLFVCEYVVWTRELDLSLGFKLTGVGRAYGQPKDFTGTQPHLYHNEGDGKFREVTEEMGIEVKNLATGVAVGKGLAVAAIDVDQDGWQDLVVANDTVQNFLYLNQAGEGFAEMGVPLGVAFDRTGNATGAMGLDCGYLRNAQSLAIAIGNFANEQSSLYMLRGPSPPFSDQAIVSGLGPQSRSNLTFGMFMADLDLDGRDDIVCANGHLEEEISKVQASQNYEQPPQFFWNAGAAGESELVQLTAEQVGESALEPMVGRGATFGDLDGDGDIDIVMIANSGRPRVLRNDQQLGHHWLRVVLEGSESNRDAVGSAVSLRRKGDTRDWQRKLVVTSRSYLSQAERVCTFGLGETKQEVELDIVWPNGQSEVIAVPIQQIDQTLRIIEGQGIAN